MVLLTSGIVDEWLEDPMWVRLSTAVPSDRAGVEPGGHRGGRSGRDTLLGFEESAARQ
jgi:hypothetical protein